MDANDTGTSPFSADTDDDGFTDDVEVAFGSDPNDPLNFPPPAFGVPGVGGLAAILLASLMVLSGGLGLRRRLAA